MPIAITEETPIVADYLRACERSLTAKLSDTRSRARREKSRLLGTMTAEAARVALTAESKRYGMVTR